MTKLFRTLDKYPAHLIGFIQGLSVAIYIALFALVIIAIQNVEPHPTQILAIVMSLLMLVFSALICGLLVLGYPIVLALRGKIKRAVTIAVYSAVFLLLILAVTSVLLLI